MLTCLGSNNAVQPCKDMVPVCRRIQHEFTQVAVNASKAVCDIVFRGTTLDFLLSSDGPLDAVDMLQDSI